MNSSLGGAARSDEPSAVAIIGAGGTLSTLGASPLDLMDYPDHGTRLTVDQVLARVPQAGEQAALVTVPFRAVGSSALTPADWFDLRRHIHHVAAHHPQVRGVVIPHGTATLEETAYFLHLTLNTDLTVVLVGAQRPLSAVGSDAPMNLISAVRVAAHPASRGRGVLVVMNDEIHSARDVAKAATLRVHAFQSTPYGALGVSDPDGVWYGRRPERPHAPHTPFSGLASDCAWPRVDIVYSYAGADGVLVDAAVAAGARGIVCAGLAPGMPARSEEDAYARAREQGVVMVQCSRVGSGRVARRRRLVEAIESGLVSADDLSPQKARILLGLCLTVDADPHWLQHCFDTY